MMKRVVSQKVVNLVSPILGKNTEEAVDFRIGIMS